MPPEPLTVDVPGAALAADRWAADGPPVVLLHAGVADRRGWAVVAAWLAAAGHDVVAYDRCGFGATPPGDAPFTHLDDLRAVLDVTAGDRPVWLVGNSMGGALALDAAVALPERVAGLVLLAPAVRWAPEPEAQDADPATLALDTRLEGATGEEAVRLETWLWLDGPAGPEGRVGGAARELALAMNRAIRAHGADEGAGDREVATAGRLAELRCPVTVAWGDVDLPEVVEASRALAAQLPRVRTHVFPGVAHLPSLEVPEAVADLVRAAVRGTPAPASRG